LKSIPPRYQKTGASKFAIGS